MKFKDLQSLLRAAYCEILGTDPAHGAVRVSYSTDGSLGFKITENVVFITLRESDDSYGRDRESVYITRDDTVYRDHSGARVWDCLITCYGPDSFEWLEKIRDGVLWNMTRRKLSQSGVYLIPAHPVINRVPEQFNGQWWNRCDMVLRYNEEYVSPELVGHIEEISVEVKANEPADSENTLDAGIIIKKG